jgi:hypothetical protein
MTITMPPVARSDLVTAIRAFAHAGQRRPLREFQRLAGWMNWALNAFPLLRPGLSMLYHKMSGKSHPHQLVWVSVMLCRELTWFADRVEMSDGVHLLDSRAWGESDADLVLYCDACPGGLAFWCPAMNSGFSTRSRHGTLHPRSSTTRHSLSSLLWTGLHVTHLCARTPHCHLLRQHQHSGYVPLSPCPTPLQSFVTYGSRPDAAVRRSIACFPYRWLR